MAIMIFLVKHRGMMVFNTGRKISMISYQLMKKFFGCAAYQENQEQECSNAFLYI